LTLLDIPRSTVYDYARRRADQLPSMQIGRHRRFHRSEVERWLARQRA
jgi:excisionase family DNA binding protein